MTIINGFSFIFNFFTLALHFFIAAAQGNTFNQLSISEKQYFKLKIKELFEILQNKKENEKN